MKVDRVTTIVRYSQDSGKGSWKSLEIGAEATIAPNENWHTAQEQLYYQLGQQMKTLWSNGAGKPQNGSEKPIQPAPQSAGPPAGPLLPPASDPLQEIHQRWALMVEPQGRQYLVPGVLDHEVTRGLGRHAPGSQAPTVSPTLAERSCL
jgi:hypothetical protein